MMKNFFRNGFLLSMAVLFCPATEQGRAEDNALSPSSAPTLAWPRHPWAHKPCPLLARGPARGVALSADGSLQHLLRFTVVRYTYSTRQDVWLLGTRTKFEFDLGPGSGAGSTQYKTFYRNENYFVKPGEQDLRFVIELFGQKEFILSASCTNDSRLVDGSYIITQRGNVIESGTVRFFGANRPKKWHRTGDSLTSPTFEDPDDLEHLSALTPEEGQQDDDSTPQ